MYRTVCIALLLGVTLLVVGCKKPETNEPESLEVPAVSEDVDGGKVAGAVGRALLKGLTGTGRTAMHNNPAESPPL